MSAATQAVMSEAEFLRFHGGETLVELVAGQVVKYPPPGGHHIFLGNMAAIELGRFVVEHDLGNYPYCGFFVRTKSNPPTLRAPEVAYLSYERWPKGPLPDQPLPVAPELVIEIRSPSDRIAAVTAKAEEYINAGVMVVVYLDPKTKCTAVFRGDEFPQRLHNGDELAFPDILPGFAVPVRTFFE